MPSRFRGVVYVGHLPYGFFRDELLKFFSQFGKITRIRHVISRKVRVYVCACAYTRVYTCMYTRVHTCVYTCVWQAKQTESHFSLHSSCSSCSSLVLPPPLFRLEIHAGLHSSSLSARMWPRWWLRPWTTTFFSTASSRLPSSHQARSPHACLSKALSSSHRQPFVTRRRSGTRSEAVGGFLLSRCASPMPFSLSLSPISPSPYPSLLSHTYTTLFLSLTLS